ncbi:MAG: hypothetical protein FWE20_09490 [Defluviitaleaceae bacterium]|nr:hypothetical protein [Defluviitaleaceae bacterium]
MSQTNATIRPAPTKLYAVDSAGFGYDCVKLVLDVFVRAVYERLPGRMFAQAHDLFDLLADISERTTFTPGAERF